MLFAQVLLLLAPWMLLVVTYFILDMSWKELIVWIGPIWIFVSPLWGIAIAWVFFWKGRTIEVLETAKFAFVTAKDNKHHAINAFNFIKRKVKRG